MQADAPKLKLPCNIHYVAELMQYVLHWEGRSWDEAKRSIGRLFYECSCDSICSLSVDQTDGDTRITNFFLVTLDFGGTRRERPVVR